MGWFRRSPGVVKFPGEEALLLAMTSGLLPEALLRSAARGRREKDGVIRVAPLVGAAEKLDKRRIAALHNAGVESDGELDGGDEVSCWAELIATRRAPEPEAEAGPVLFVLPSDQSLLHVAGELLRLGCDRQEFRAADSGWLLRVTSPPYYTLLRALDHESGLRAYLPALGGSGRVWIEIGFQHPLASRLGTDGDAHVLIPGSGRWRSLADGKWSPLYEIVELCFPARPAALVPRKLAARLTVQLKLARGGRLEAPSLWVLRDEGEIEPEVEIDRLVRTLPDDLLARLLFAVATVAGERVVVLKARPSQKGPPEIALRGESYAPLLGLGNLFVPCDAIVEPPLRRDKLREVLASDGARITWLAATANGDFRVESIEESALVPLSDWIDYVVHSNAPALAPWMRNATFAFEAFESIGAEWGETKVVAAEPEEHAHAEPKSKRRRREPAAPTVVKTSAGSSEPEITEKVSLAITARERSPLEDELTKLEAEFIALDAAADGEARQAMWQRMAELNGTLGRPRDAGLCWTHALWELAGDDAAKVLARWRRFENATPATWDRLLDLTAPTRDETRAAAALLVAGDRPPRDLHRVARFFDRHGDNLDLRSAWLVSLALARLAGGDRLALTRARDAILGKLHRGLSVERDVPTFLRFVGGRDAPAAERLAAQLETLLTRFDKSKRSRSAVEAPPELTSAYVRFVMASGFARLGQSDRARALTAEATSRLDLGDPIHGFLARAYAARVEQAIEGRPAESPLPPSVAGELNELEKFFRYKVDRLRQASQVLEPHERLDPVRAFQRGERDPRGDEFAALRGMTDVAAVALEVDRIMSLALASSPALEPSERARLLDGVMDFFPTIAESQAVPHLARIGGSLEGIAPVRQAQLLEEALSLAGHFGRGELVKTLLGALKNLVAELGADDAAEVCALLGGCMRTLRRVGLREEAAGLLDALASSATGRGAALVVGRLHLAAGLAYLGHLDRAHPIFDEAKRALAEPALLMPDRLAITRALARAVGNAPEEYAAKTLDALSEGLVKVTDSFNTNSHFCLSVVSFVEALVLGWASEDLALGELGQRWLDEDEFLIRRRIHSDLELSREST